MELLTADLAAAAESLRRAMNRGIEGDAIRPEMFPVSPGPAAVERALPGKCLALPVPEAPVAPPAAPSNRPSVEVKQ